MMLNRTVAPTLQSITSIPFPDYEEVVLPGGTRIFFLPYGLQPVMGIEFVYNAGQCRPQRIGVSPLTAELLTEGTTTRTAYQIAQEIDSFGAYLHAETSTDFTTISLHTLTQFFEPTFEVLADVLKNASFTADEYQSKLKRTLQNISVEEQKTSWQAKKRFLAGLYGNEHPYASTIGKEELEKLNVELLKDYYSKYFHPSQCFVIVTGIYDRTAVLDKLSAFFDGIQVSADAWGTVPNNIQPTVGYQTFDMPDNLQCSIRVGHLGFRRNHPDVYKMRVTNTVLGGYFGSRLMQNIREDKGYTYGIGSAWISNKEGGYFTIATDVGKDFVEDTLRQIKIEINRLIEEKISDDELEVVKNYMLGKIVSDMETPFQLADRLKHAVVFGFSKEEMNHSFEAIQTTTADDVLTMAQTYFQPEQLLEVVCGKL
jgi:predicted Zn-dependent peptidase